MTRPKCPPYRETGVAIPLSHCVSCGIADYPCYTPTSFRKNGLSQSKDRPNKGGIAEKLASEANRAIGGDARNSIANRAIYSGTLSFCLASGWSQSNGDESDYNGLVIPVPNGLLLLLLAISTQLFHTSRQRLHQEQAQEALLNGARGTWHAILHYIMITSFVAKR